MRNSIRSSPYQCRWSLLLFYDGIKYVKRTHAGAAAQAAIETKPEQLKMRGAEAIETVGDQWLSVTLTLRHSVSFLKN